MRLEAKQFVTITVSLFALAVVGLTPATAQEFRIPADAAVNEVPGAAFPAPAELVDPSATRTLLTPTGQSYTNNIMLIGYWPPTNEMLRQFSQNPDQNPGAWVGENWENRGYNVYAFFPEFPNGLGKGEGDFEVDYQDTSADFWPLVDQLRPIAIVTFGRSGYDNDWELEGGHRMYTLSHWSNDYLSPYDPTPDLPIASEPPGFERYSSLPLQRIIDALNDAGTGVFAYATALDTSRFLCNFAGYHACWWHDDHSDPNGDDWNIAAGHVHVGYNMTDATATEATEVTLRALTGYLDEQIAALPQIGDLNCDGAVNAADIDPFVLALTDPAGYAALYPACDVALADANQDGSVNAADIDPFVVLVVGG